MRRYNLGEGIDGSIAALIEEAAVGNGDGTLDADQQLVAEMIVTGLKLLGDGTDRGDLKLINSSLKEMRYAFRVFARYRHIPKVTIYGSARTPPDDPNYKLAAEFAGRMADLHRWMIVTGAGPGIMEAGNLGAGREYGFGVNIRLPFEADANEYIHESRLINFKYFFTRKLVFVKESDAFVVFPGGFGTQDEVFELLTLIQTGKSDLHPVVLFEAPGTGYWEAWLDMIGVLEGQGMISPDDRGLFLHTSDVDEACREILRFYHNYHSQRFVEGKLVLRLRHQPSDALVAELNDSFADIVAAGSIVKIGPTDAERADDDHLDLHRICLRFNRRSLGRLRRLVDRLNAEAAPGELESPPADHGSQHAPATGGDSEYDQQQ